MGCRNKKDKRDFVELEITDHGGSFDMGSREGEVLWFEFSY